MHIYIYIDLEDRYRYMYICFYFELVLKATIYDIPEAMAV